MTGSIARRSMFMLAVLGLAGCSHGADAREAADAAGGGARPDGMVALDSAQRRQIRTETLAPSAFTASIVTTGTVAFNGDRSTQVLAPISGPVSHIFVSPGAEVGRGQALARVASPDFAVAVADFRKAEASWRNAQRIATLDEQLFANDAIARRDLDQARTDLAGAAADRDAAISQMQSLGVDSASIAALREGRTVSGAEAAIRAPIAGTLVERLITPGQLLQAGTTPCFTIADLSTVWVLANVFESDLAAAAKGEAAVVTTDASPDSFPGRVDYVAALVDPATKATAVRILVPNRGHVLKRDMLVRVTIHALRARTGLLVPVSAVLRDDENLPFVFVARGGGSYARQRVDLGGRVGDRYEITSGLLAGARVVTEGALFLEGAGAP